MPSLSGVRAQPIEAGPDNAAETAIAELGRELLALGYRFVAPTPETHRRAIAGRSAARDPRDVFGWSLPFAEDTLPPRLLALLGRARALDRVGARWRSRLRFASLGDRLFAHSAYPTSAADAVFFGPDTYRFARLLEATVVGRHRRCVDIGCGSGAAGLLLAGRCDEVVLADVNPAALALARANAALNDVPHATTTMSDVLDGITGDIDLVVANPPYLADEAARVYRDGGGELGTGLALRILEQALARLSPGGLLVLYTGTPVIAGQDRFWRAARERLAGIAGEIAYHELDPDVFGEELERPAYVRASCERIAVVGLVVRLAVQR